MKSKIKIVISILITLMLISGFWILNDRASTKTNVIQNQTLQLQENISNPKLCSISDSSDCNRSCNTDEDCVIVCYRGSMNKNEIFDNEGNLREGWEGYRDCFKTEKLKRIIAICMSNGICGTGSLPPTQISMNVTITTNKTIFRTGEDIEINIINDDNITAYVRTQKLKAKPSSYEIELETYENNSWHSTNYALDDGCFPESRRYHVAIPIIGCIEIGAGAALQRTKPLFYSTCKNQISEDEPLPQGMYRFKIDVGNDCSSLIDNIALRTIYSNEFTIK